MCAQAYVGTPPPWEATKLARAEIHIGSDLVRRQPHERRASQSSPTSAATSVPLQPVPKAGSLQPESRRAGPNKLQGRRHTGGEGRSEDGLDRPTVQDARERDRHEARGLHGRVAVGSLALYSTSATRSAFVSALQSLVASLARRRSTPGVRRETAVRRPRSVGRQASRASQTALSKSPCHQHRADLPHSIPTHRLTLP